MTFRHYNPRTQCDGKRPYRDKATAKTVAKRSERSLRQRLHPYRCPHCGYWHLGHKPRPWKFDERSATA